MHLLMLLLMIAVYAMINLHDLAPKGSDLRAVFKIWHFVLGLGVFGLVLLRLGVRFYAGTAPRITPPIPQWQKYSAVAVHIALYLFMLGMSLLGWFVVSAKDAPIVFYGLQLPALIGEDKLLYDSLKSIHGLIGTIGYHLIGVHAAAALLHHYVMRDDSLRRMLPRRD